MTDITVASRATAFSACSGLKDFYCLSENVPNTENIFSELSLSSLVLHVPAVSLEAYSTASYWQRFGQIVAIDEGDGIKQVTSETFTNPTAYDLSGRRTANKQKGINLLRNADGQVKKVLRR